MDWNNGGGWDVLLWNLHAASFRVVLLMWSSLAVSIVWNGLSAKVSLLHDTLKEANSISAMHSLK